MTDTHAPQQGFLHLLFSPRAEGCPRLARSLLEQEREQTGRVGQIVYLVDQPDDMCAEFESMGIPQHLLGWSPKRFVALYRRALTLFSQLRPPAIICYTVGQHIAIGHAARKLGIPMILHMGTAAPRQWLARNKIALALQLGDKVTLAYAACSDYVAQICRDRYKLPAGKIHSVPNGIDLQRFLASRDTPAGSDIQHRKLGMVANLEAAKNQDQLLDAFALAHHQVPGLQLHMIGDGSLADTLKAQAERLGISDAVHWHGRVEDIPQALRSLDVFLYTVSEEEGLGIALVEALAAGRPVIATDVGAPREVLRQGEWGLLVPRDQPQALAEAMLVEQLPAPPSADELARYDIAATYRGYAGLIKS